MVTLLKSAVNQAEQVEILIKLLMINGLPCKNNRTLISLF